jgi:uncharacterized membrane protein YcjF (UPF0283 family)
MEPTPPITRLAQTRPQLEQQQEQQTAAARAGREFASPDEMLRYDAAQTPPPPAVEQRLKDSIAQEPRPRRSWWRRLFGGQ